MVAKTEAALAALSAQFKARTVMRTYQSITLGCPREAAGQVRTNVGRHFRERKKMGVYEYGGSRWARFCLRLSMTPLPLQRPCASPCMRARLSADRHGRRVSAGHPSGCLPVVFDCNLDCLASPMQAAAGAHDSSAMFRQAPVAAYAGAAQPSATIKC